jgi:hypothetical protein
LLLKKGEKKMLPFVIEKRGEEDATLLLLNKRWNSDGIFFPLFLLENQALVSEYQIRRII